MDLELPVLGAAEVLTKAETKRFVKLQVRMFPDPDKKDPSKEEELGMLHLLSPHQAQLARASSASLAACLARNPGFYRVEEVDYRIVYYCLVPEPDYQVIENVEELTEAAFDGVLRHAPMFLHEKGPSKKEKLLHPASLPQAPLVRASSVNLAACLPRIRGFYQAGEGDHTFVYHLGPGLHPLGAKHADALTEAVTGGVFGRMQKLLEEKGPSQLLDPLSTQQALLVRATSASLAACMTRIRGFYQAAGGDYTYDYPGSQFDCLFPSPCAGASLATVDLQGGGDPAEDVLVSAPAESTGLWCGRATRCGSSSIWYAAAPGELEEDEEDGEKKRQVWTRTAIPGGVLQEGRQTETQTETQ